MIAQNIQIEELTGYSADTNDMLVNAPCCCHGDNHTGHPYCSDPTPELLQAEQDGLIVRQLDTGWQWRIA